VIETDGPHHFEVVYFDGITPSNLSKTQSNDRLKDNYLRDQNIHLLRVAYSERFNSLDYIVELLQMIKQMESNSDNQATVSLFVTVGREYDKIDILSTKFPNEDTIKKNMSLANPEDILKKLTLLAGNTPGERKGPEGEKIPEKEKVPEDTKEQNVPATKSSQNISVNSVISARLHIIPKIDQSWTISRIAREAVPAGWEEFFKSALPELDEISQILDEKDKTEGTYYPLKKDIFYFLRLIKPHQVRVCITAQDPYPQTLTSGLPRAMGLAFSVRKGDSIPSSLKNIYTEISNSVKEFKIPNHGDLSDWARRGVFLPNMCLTVKPNEAGSHGQIWLGFIVKMLTYINSKSSGVIYLLLGKEAQKIQRSLDNKVVVLTSVHPSGLSCHRGFIGCGHFKKINDILESREESPINWNLT
jgi:uracil-DNA glycosylase